MNKLRKAYLILEDGTVFEGEGFGAAAGALGELVFTTGMCGYLETLTDPSYYGQIVLQTFPLIGNYGVIPADFEGQCCVKGYVVREWCEVPSNFRSEGSLGDFLKAQGVPGICGVDTRRITRLLREKGVMNAVISDSPTADLAALAAYRVTNAVQSVTCAAPSLYPAAGEERFRVTLMDFGAKRNIIRELQKRGCAVKVVPASTTAEAVLAERPDGVMLSNGPGDPAENEDIIREIAALCGKVPIFGICLGHQLLALANGGKTVKLKYGHRGVNQPAREIGGPRTYITSQNHGYAVVSDGMTAGRPSFYNANDNTCEGMEYPALRAFSVQFHPEACSGPRDTSFLFDRFLALMGGTR